MNELLDALSEIEIKQILKALSDEDSKIAKKIETLANKNICNINIADLASEVFWVLDSLDVEELWKNSGTSRYGYEDPGEVAHEMVRAALESFNDKILNYRKLGLYHEEKLYCMGILKGIDMYTNSSQSEFKDWATDSPGIFFDDILDDWKKSCKTPRYINEMDEFLSSQKQLEKLKFKFHKDF